MNLDAQTQAGGARFRQAALFSPQTRLFMADDADGARQGVGRVFKPHDLAPAHRGGSVSASMHLVRRGRLSLCRLEYGSDVRIDPGPLEHFYLIQIPVQGGAEIRCGALRFESSPEVASLISPDLPLSMRWQGGAPQVALRIEREDLERHCRQHLGPSSDCAPTFDPALDFSTPGGAYFLHLLGMMVEALGSDHHPIHQPLVFEQFKATLFNALLYGIPHDASARLSAPHDAAPVSPYFVKRAEEYVLAHLHEPLTVELIAEHVGVSVRTLFSGFRDFRRTTPMAWVRGQRLARVRQELLERDDASVTEVAFRWGVTHLGRFAQEYKKRFGESPSATRRYRQP